jgi:hypothetical protein
MKTTSLLISTALALAALSAPVFAQSETNRTVERVTNPGGPDTVIVVDKTMPNRDVTSLAGRYEDGADIAVIGRVSSKDESGFLLDRKDGQVRALIGDPGDDRVKVGDVVTVYGRLKREPMDVVQVETEAVRDQASGSTYLTMLGHQRTAQSTAAGKTVTLNYHPL